MEIYMFQCWELIDGLEQDCSNSNALAMELLQIHAKPSWYTTQMQICICFLKKG